MVVRMSGVLDVVPSVLCDTFIVWRGYIYSKALVEGVSHWAPFGYGCNPRHGWVPECKSVSQYVFVIPSLIRSCLTEIEDTIADDGKHQPRAHFLALIRILINVLHRMQRYQNEYLGSYFMSSS